MRVLVTGGAGYIGSHACKVLARSGHEPTVYDNLSEGHRSAVKWGPFELGDINDQARLKQVMETHRPDAVMHFAAYTAVGESVSNPQKYYYNNVVGTLSLLSAMRELDVNRFVFSSTCATYGLPLQTLITEDHDQAPITPYGRSKLMIENILRDYADAYGLRAIALRYFNAAGADPEGELGERHEPETHLIPLVLRAAAGADKEITIFGDDYDTADGTCIRDYTHVVDLALAHVRALERMAADGGFSAYNLGTGCGLSVRSIIDVARKVTGRPIRVKVGPRRPGDPDSLVAEPSLAGGQLGWRPQYSSPETIVETAWRWLTQAAD
jgi:UDP-arabinose 4-epimerase